MAAVAWRLAGQPSVVAMLARALREDRLSHAYLFVGPAHVGKATAARELAMALNCRGEEPPCHRCRQCHLIDVGRHPDVELIGVGGLCEEPDHRDHRTDGSKDIRICQVRRLQRLLSRAPFEGRCRVAIVDPADALNVEAANAFLKTLEEPPASVVLVLVTSREEALPPTVLSRCRRVPFRLMAVADVEQALVEGWSVTPEKAGTLARLSGGRLGWAVSALEDEGLLPARESVLDEVQRLAGASLSERFAYAGRLGYLFSREREAVFAALALWEEWWRDLLLVGAGCGEQAVNSDRLDKLAAESRKYRVRAVVRFLEALSRARQQLQENVNPLLTLEVLMLDLPAPVLGKEAGFSEPPRGLPSTLGVES
jgi:DNA polymerase-3 subunit delta'